MQPHDVLFPILFWALAIYVCRPSMLEQEDWRDRRVLGTRVFVIGMAISLTIQAHPLGAIFDAAIGLNNISWFLGYSNAVVAVYAGASAIFIVRSKFLPKWLSVASVAALGVFVLIMPWLIATPEEFHNELPHSAPLLLLRGTLYAYVFLVAFACMRMFREWIKEETHPTGYLRGTILLFGFSAVLAFSLLRASSALVAFLVPAWEWNKFTLQASDLLLVTSIVAIFFGIAPVSWLRLPIRIANYIEQHRALRDLERLRHTLVAATGNVPWAQPAYADRWFNLPFVLYCACIDILDRRMLLQAQLNDGKTSSHEHERVAKLLEDLPDTPDWIELVQHLRRVAQNVKANE